MKLRFGMVGGGEGSMIGPVHRLAAQHSGEAELVCGAFSSTPDRSYRSGQRLYQLAAHRCYASYSDMFAKEAALPADKRMNFVVIATPNHLHFPVAMAALAAGFHVVCDKPLTHDFNQAQLLRRRVLDSGLQFAVTYNYSGYAMLQEARDLVSRGSFGSLRRISCEYLQGWLAVDMRTNKQAQWRADPVRAGSAGCFGDIGSHGYHLMEYVSGLPVTWVCADLSKHVPGRQLDDDGNVLLRFAGGAKGVLSASQVAAGEDNDIQIKVFGELGGFSWRLGEPDILNVRWLSEPNEVRRAKNDAELAPKRSIAGAPDGYLDAFAEIYRRFFAQLKGESHRGFPTIEEGVRGMQFLAAVVRSDEQGATWQPL
jgi:predicted dehydrogenase